MFKKEIENKILELERKLLDNSVRTDGEKLKELLDESYIEIGSSGRLFYYDDYFVDNGAGERDIEMKEYRVQWLTADVIQIIYTLVDHERNNKTLRSSIWRQSSGKWKQVFHQGTIATEI